MINIIWLVMILIGIAVAAIRCLGITFSPLGIYLAPTFEPLSQLTNSAFDYSKFAVELALGLVGIMALWLGIMKIAEKSGLIKVIARGLRPVMVKLFPDVQPEHPAMGSIIMALSATMLGLGNASTPLGLKAFQDMQKLNKHKYIATNAQCTFMAMSTSSITVIPATIIGIRTAAGSENPDRDHRSRHRCHHGLYRRSPDNDEIITALTAISGGKLYRSGRGGQK
ncbi:MAG: nucleoside recognition domain-containing protein [Candidatus Marinimicrobia bacterium]|nr:nucleoside recognition domain-containing protein [Candidatus Neomarinimicrobiota bacterium]